MSEGRVHPALFGGGLRGAPPYTQPEIQRANLAEVILRMKAFHYGDIETFPFLNPPAPNAIRAGYQLLQELGALDEGASPHAHGQGIGAPCRWTLPWAA